MRGHRSDKGSWKVNMPFCEIYRMYYVDMLPASDLAESFGCEKSAVLRRMRSMGLPVRHHNDTKRGAKARNRIELPADEVLNAYSVKYESCASVGRKFGVSAAVISRILSENNTPKKPFSETKNVKKENHPGWNPEKTEKEREQKGFDPELSVWREAVYSRDSYTCIKCGDSSGSNLNAHHINPYWKHRNLRKEIDNGATLCGTCHMGFHKIYGFKHFTERDFKEWLK